MIVFSILNFTEKEKNKYIRYLELWLLHEFNRKLLYSYCQRYNFDSEYKGVRNFIRAKPTTIIGVYHEIAALQEGVGLEKLGKLPQELRLDEYSEKIILNYYAKKVASKTIKIFEKLCYFDRGILELIISYLFGNKFFY